MNYHSQGELEAFRAQAVLDFLTANHGAILLSETSRSAIIQTEGLSRSQIKGHLIACALTLGLWAPVFAMIGILRAPRQVLIHVNDDGKVWELDLDV